MTGFDLSAYLGVFLDEVDEQLQILDTEILRLEIDPTNEETIQNIFRAAHTLKGSSATMGFEKMKDFTHHLENIFEQVRQQKLTVTGDLITIIFNSIDVIKQLKEAIVAGELEQMEIAQFIEELEQFSNEAHPSTKAKDMSVEILLDEHQKNVISNAMALGHHAFAVGITLEKQAMMKSVRALLIHNHLMEHGDIIASFPAIELTEDEDNFDGHVTFIFITMQTAEEIEALLRHMSDVEQINVHLIGEEHLHKKGVTESVAPVSLEDNGSKEKVVQKAKVASTVRVDVDRLEHLMNLVGELVIDQTRLVDVRGRFAEKDLRDESEFEVLDEVTNHLSRVISELQEGMMKTRMLPIEQLFNRFPRMVRDTAVKAQKEIAFDMQGKETELDRTLIEEISDPIIHLLRNAIDHGIESPEQRVRLGKPASGKVTLRAAHEENHVVISITDDGRGIDPERIKKTSVEKGMITEEEAKQLSDKDAMFLIFKSGISTAEKITDISGRGVGMDIVNTHIEKLNGMIDITSVVGEGTTFTVKLPLTLAIIRSLLVKFGEKTFAIPLVNVLEIIRLNKEEIQMVKGQEVGMVRGRILPLVRMKERLGIEGDLQVEKKREFVIVVGIADKRIGLIADKTIGNQEIVIKSLGSYIGSPPFISGATIMGDGDVALILDVSSVVRDHGAQVLEQDDSTLIKMMEDERQLVTFKLDTEEYGIEIQRAKDIIAVPTITKVVEAPEELLGIINLRGNMLPVIDLRKRFKLPHVAPTKKSRIIIVEHGLYDVGFLVDEVTQVLKINHLSIEQPKQEHQYNASNLIKGISKLDNRVVLILAFDEIVASLKYEHITQTISQ
ncbi:MAG: chemotaxis protein CheW [Solibacillus sp.]